MATITVHNISYAFPGARGLFFDNLSLVIPTTGITFLRGKNGVGKSTLLHAIAGQLYAGTVSGQLITPDTTIELADSALVRQHVALVTQEVNNALALSYTVRMNLLGAACTQAVGFNFLPAQAAHEELLASCGIAPEALVGQLSGGQRQMVAVVSMLQKNRQLLVLDEPTAALDEVNTQRLFSLILQMQSQHPFAVLCITHDDAVMQRFDNGASLVLAEKNGIRVVSPCGAWGPQ